jgi:hypothetical protein
MNKSLNAVVLASAAMLAAAGVAIAEDAAKPDPKMSFFVTSAGPGSGGDLGGLAGADKHCQSLAAAAGAGKKTWHAYLSTAPMDGKPGVDARDRIGKGPWFNFKGEQVAANVDDLHSANNKLAKETSLTEKGAMVNGVGDTPNQHDVMTGSGADGRLAQPAPIPPPPNAPAGTAPSPAPKNLTCNNWSTSAAGPDVRASLGHVDRKGGGAAGTSWNNAHASRGCSQPELVQTGGAGLFYCFAAK